MKTAPVLFGCALSLSHRVFYHYEQEIIKSPKDEIPSRSMPEACQSPDHKEIQGGPCGRALGTSEGNIYIIPEEGGK